MLRKHRQEAAATANGPDEESSMEQSDSFEEIALTLSCGGAFLAPRRRELKEPGRLVQCPSRRGYLLQEDGSLAARARALLDEQKFCESVTRLLSSSESLQGAIHKGLLHSLS